MKYISFLKSDDELLKKYIEIWEKVTNSVKKGFYSELIYNEIYLKAKIKFYEGKTSNDKQYRKKALHV